MCGDIRLFMQEGHIGKELQRVRNAAMHERSGASSLTELNAMNQGFDTGCILARKRSE